ncbi:SagB/ThcOx family dehydrogenase [Nonomuraea sp. NPDC049725]|uniref:SagB/ThcOx family dehydrogenase n=1 Tax=Nonomuraea sp. NPDC049725 TaxID=3154508 RepID=UPI0034129B73
MTDTITEALHVPAHVELVRGPDGRWLADDLLTNRRFALDATTLKVLVSVAAGADAAGLDPERLARLAALGLVRRGTAWSEELRRGWRARNWEAAARYHVATFDYPFLDYSAAKGGFAVDRQQMGEFRQIEPDMNRVKSYPGAETFPLPRPSAGLLDGPVAMTPETARQEPPPDALARVLSMAFGAIGEIHYDVQPAAPALRRTSPSGGARHPCEAYLYNLGFEEFPAGVYHVHPTEPRLESVAEVPPEEQLAAQFQATWVRAPFTVRAIVVVTCVFERNMYRYREPRTFRTVHMDAGHLAATVELAARSLGLRTFTQYRDSEPLVEAHLGLHHLEEGYLLSVGLGRWEEAP